MRYEPTGEFRPPKTEESYVSPGNEHLVGTSICSASVRYAPYDFSSEDPRVIVTEISPQLFRPTGSFRRLEAGEYGLTSKGFHDYSGGTVSIEDVFKATKPTTNPYPVFEPVEDE